MTNQSPAEALRHLPSLITLELRKYYPEVEWKLIENIMELVTAYAATVEREDLERLKQRIRPELFLDPKTAEHTAGIVKYEIEKEQEYCRLAALQGPIQGDSNTSEEASSTQ